MTVPLRGLKSDVACNNWRTEFIVNNCITVLIAIKDLKAAKQNKAFYAVDLKRLVRRVYLCQASNYEYNGMKTFSIIAK